MANDADPLETIYADDLSVADAAALAELLHRTWPADSADVKQRQAKVAAQWRGYQGPDETRPRYFVIRQPASEGNNLAACAQAQPRTIAAEGRNLTILALARVCVAPEYRGTGLGRRVVLRAFEMIDQGIYEFALFQTTPPVESFYVNLGATRIDNDIINSFSEEPSPHPFWDGVVMRYPADKTWPTGTIDLRGPGY